MKKKITYSDHIFKFASSRYFFWGILALLVIQALWIAISGRYPMVFDEDFHLGIIRIYSHHISPFWDAQPPGADAYGAVFRDPSYLYHYLMSFPYRIISGVTDNMTAQVISLRLLNISLFSSSLILWRKLLLKTGASRALVHSSLLVFVLLPIVPLLAAQINYDNLFIPVVAVVLLLAVDLGQDLRKYKLINTKVLMQLSIMCLLAGLVKYAFLPILAAIFAYMVICMFQTKSSLRKLLLSAALGWSLMTRTVRWGLVVIFILFVGLFAERYAVNIVRYHQPVPECDKVLNVKQCSAYGPWARNYILTGQKSSTASNSPFDYSGDWFYGMWLRTFFAVDGPATNYETRGPLVLPGIGAIVFACAGFVAFLIEVRQLWRRYDRTVLTLLAVVIAAYLAVLWFDGYQSFVKIGQTVAVNGRYLLPIALPLILLGVLGLNQTMRGRSGLKLVTGLVVVICLAWGGGNLTYILRSRDVWLWPNHTVVLVNQSVRNSLGPLIPGYSHPTEFMSRN